MFTGGLTLERMMIYGARIAVFLLIIPIHESAHGLMAKWLGDDTAEKEGRITLNPMAHLDVAGFILMLLLGFGWAKPVPVNVSNLKHRRAGYALVSAAGPLSNLIAAFLGAAVCTVILSTEKGQTVALEQLLGEVQQGNEVWVAVLMLLLNFVQINVGLAMFNLIPLPPLDGFNLVRAFLPARADRWLFEHQHTVSGAFIVLILVASYVPEVNAPLMYVIEKVSDFIWWSVSWIEPLMSK